MNFSLGRMFALLTIVAACMAIWVGTHPLLAIHALAFALMLFLCIGYREGRVRIETSSDWLTGYLVLVMVIINAIGIAHILLDRYLGGYESQCIKFPPIFIVTLFTVAPVLVVMAFCSWCVGTILEKRRQRQISE